MSTRASIKVTDGNSEQYFYRHSDGYPEGALPSLERFMQLVADAKIRNNVSQASGWLVIIGAEEYGQSLKDLEKGSKDSFSSWKVGSMEPCNGKIGWIEYLYILDLVACTITYMQVDGNEKTIEATAKTIYFRDSAIKDPYYGNTF